jgi:PKD-like domain
MYRSQGRLLGYLLPLALAAFVLVPSQASAQLRGANDRENFVNSPATLTLTSDTSVVSACTEGSLPRVKLNAQANSPSGNPIRYRWTTSAGRIIGEGPVVTWDLAGLSPGYYKAFIEIETGDGDLYCQAFSSRSILVNPCALPRPVCPNVSVSCPTSVVIDQPITFTSNVTGGIPAGAHIYEWSVSAGTIIEGQGTPTIKVDTRGLAGETIRATLTMGGLPLNCSDSCAVQVPIPQRTCRKFDEFPAIARNDEKARLDNYGIELQNDPTSTAYVTVYPGRSSKSGDVQRHSARIIDYLVNSRGIDARRIVTRVGPVRDELMVELWACPQGVTPPRP